MCDESVISDELHKRARQRRGAGFVAREER